MIAKLLSFITLVAVIRSSDIRDVKIFHCHGSESMERRLCADFDVQESGQTIKQSYQCGFNWDDIRKGIRWQLKEIRQEKEAEQAERDQQERMQRESTGHDGEAIRE